jgi:hypothetical protein
MKDLYSLPVEGAQFTTFCGGAGGDSDDESCIQAAPIPGAPGAYVMRSNLPGGESANLRATTDELRSFVAGIAPELGLTVMDASA